MANNELSPLAALKIIEAEIIAKNGEDYQLEDDEKLFKSLRIVKDTLKDYDRLEDTIKYLYKRLDDHHIYLDAGNIIKKKKVNVSLFCSVESVGAYNAYIAMCKGSGLVKNAELLTEEEYDLLKEFIK